MVPICNGLRDEICCSEARQEMHCIARHRVGYHVSGYRHDCWNLLCIHETTEVWDMCDYRALVEQSRALTGTSEAKAV